MVYMIPIDYSILIWSSYQYKNLVMNSTSLVWFAPDSLCSDSVYTDYNFWEIQNRYFLVFV